MKIKKTVTAGLASIGLVVGLSGFAGASTGTNSYTGPDSYNKVRNKTVSRTSVENKNYVQASNENNQSAHTGEASATHNTTAGDAWSGNAENANSLSASMTVDNSAAAAAAVAAPVAPSHTGTNNMTGPDSHNYVENSTYTSVEVENRNCISIDNTNNQTATSGAATVEDNTSGGSAISGDAVNTNATTVNFAITN